MIPGFREIWCVDYEFGAAPGERPDPVCVVAREMRSSKLIRLWQDDLKRLHQPPYSVAEDSLLVAYYASAEVGCHLALGWRPPTNVLDLYTEFRVKTNGLPTPSGAGLLGACVYHGLDAMAAAEKDEMRHLALRGGPWTPEEARALLDYCESDVNCLARLLPKMVPRIDLPRALLRGRYMVAAARMEHAGTPIDVPRLHELRENWEDIQDALISDIDKDFGVFDGRTFKADRWAAWLAAHDIPWSRLESGALDLTDDTFDEMSRAYPSVKPIRQLRKSLSQMRLSDLAVGGDGRNRCLLSAFRAITGRNQPSNAKFIFGPASWLRGLIRPEPGWGLAYIDYGQQEFAIAAALSKDPNMMAAYTSGDPYLAFAKQCGAVPAEATKETHKAVRDQFKACVLGVQYAMEAESLALRIGKPVIDARELLRLHRTTYPVFWRWSDAAVDHAMLTGSLNTVFGWTINVGSNANSRSLRNFPMQANGAEMLRLACCFATERGIQVCAPVHDAILVEAPLDQLDEVVKATQDEMRRASEIVLDGFPLRSDAKIIRYPDRYMSDSGKEMWDRVWKLIEERRNK